jgi:hypothetical protein
MTQADDFIPAPIPGEGFEGPLEGEPLPPPDMGGFSLPKQEEQAGWPEGQSETGWRPESSAHRPLGNESEFLR